jgi:phosphoglycerol transferase MdoB-like AlkP superfamily enzyme
MLPVALRMKPPIYDYSCLNLNVGDGKFYVESLALVTITCYLISYVLYARIFYTVRKSSLNVGMQREGKLAKRIMVVISTNLFFLFVPMVAGQLLAMNITISWVAKMTCWNAILLSLLGINSCLNPLLYAFRIERFRSALKRRLKCGQNAIEPGTSNK